MKWLRWAGRAWGRLGDFSLATQPVWAAPVFFLLLARSPYFWVGWILALVPWVYRIWRRQLFLTPFAPALALFLVGILVGLYFSVDRGMGLEALQTYLASILVFYGFAAREWYRYWKVWVPMAILLLISVSVWVFLQSSTHINPWTKVTPWNEWLFRALRPLPKLSSAVPTSNGLAAFVGAAVPVAFGVALFYPATRPRLAAGAIGLLLLTVVFLTGDRSGWLGVGLALAVLALWRTRWSLVALPALGFLVAALVFVLWGGWDTFANWFSPSSLERRFAIWRGVYHMFQDLPYTGAGLGSLPRVYPLYMLEGTYLTDNPHNAFAMLYSDAGPFGLAAFVLAVVIAAVVAVRILRGPHSNVWYGIGIGLMGSLVAGGVDALFEASIAGAWLDGSGRYHYFVWPLVWAIAGGLVAAASNLHPSIPKGEVHAPQA